MLAPNTAHAQRLGATTDGYTYALRVTASATDAGGKRSDEPPIVAQARVSGDGGRIDILQGDGQYFRTGNFVVTPDAGRTVFIVDPTRRAYSRESSETKVRQEMRDKKINAVITNLTIRTDSLGPCDSVDGHPTVCVDVVKRYDVTVKFFFFTHRGTITESIRYWVATDLPGLTNAVAAYVVGQSFIVIDDNDPALIVRARRLDADWRSAPVVRMRYTATELTGGKTSSQHSLVEVSNVQHAALDPSIFELPASFRSRP